MLIFKHHSGGPSDHVVKYVRGRQAKEGKGLDFLYLPCITKVVSVPTHSLDAHFTFEGRTSDFQPIRVKGDLVYRIIAPRKAAALLDFTVRQRGNGGRDGHNAILRRRVLGVARSVMLDELNGMAIKKALSASPLIGKSVKIRMSHSRQLNDLGVRVIAINIASIEGPEHVAEAFEAESLRSSILASQSSGNMLVMARSGGLSEHRTEQEEETSTPSIECSDTCPFRQLCGDYMRNLRGGRAWCTLFHEFST
jgi:hypothetical protein